MTASSKGLKALVYDAYGTLFDTSSVVERCEHHFPGKGSAVSDIWRTKQLEYTWLRSLMGRYENFWNLTESGLRFACKSVGLELTDDILRDLMENYLKLAPYPEVPDTLARLAGKIPQAVLSNGSPDMLNQVVENNGLRSHFQAILSVDELAVFKPSPRVYRSAIERLGLGAGEIGFVSSNCWDAIGAKSFGLTVFWINRFNRPLEELGVVPDHEIRTLDEVEPFFE